MPPGRIGFARFILFTAAFAVTPAAAQSEAAATLRHIVSSACAEREKSAAEIAELLGGAQLVDEADTLFRASTRRINRTFGLPSGDEARLMTLRRDGVLFRLFAELHRPVGESDPRPVMMAITDGACQIVHARRITYQAGGRPDQLVFLSNTLVDTDRRVPFNPPVPVGIDPGGVTVALVDSGINYGLPLFADRLARDSAGRALGVDYWELDDRPYDIDISRSPFFPGHHGTRVASVLVRAAPRVRLIPYRYPRPDMSRMRDLVADAEAKGTRVFALPMGSNSPDDWGAFAKAARARPHILFVISAGNNGRDIDRRPVYPAALEIDNAIVVTSGYRDGRLARGSNWGARSVDLIVPAEDVVAIDHRGATSQASGSSFAVPLVSAMAARLAARQPIWAAAELKNAILEQANSVPGDGAPVVRHGWIDSRALLGGAQ